jgi:hypothetical protein
VPEIKDLVFAKTSPKRSFSMTENERFGLIFANTGSINSGTGGNFNTSESFVRNLYKIQYFDFDTYSTHTFILYARSIFFKTGEGVT